MAMGCCDFFALFFIFEFFAGAFLISFFEWRGVRWGAVYVLPLLFFWTVLCFTFEGLFFRRVYHGYMCPERGVVSFEPLSLSFSIAPSIIFLPLPLFFLLFLRY